MAPSRLVGALSVLLLVFAGRAGAQAGQAEDPCARSRLGELALSLFPPASAQERLGAVEKLSECKTAAVVGLLEQKVFRDEDQAVRVAAVHALAANPTPEALASLRHASGFKFNKALLDELNRAVASRTPPSTGTAQGTATAQGTPGAQGTATAQQGTATAQGTTTGRGTAAQGTGTQGTATLVPKRPATPRTPPAPRPPEPYIPFEQRDGLAFSVTTSAIAGGTLMPFLAALAQQKNPLTLTLTSAAGAIIGGGSAWGLSLFGMRQRLPQAVWYANSTAWGTLAGLSLYSGLVAQGNMTAEDKDRALWGMLTAGETVGLASGIWSASMYEWKPRQIVVADTLLIGAVLTYGGARIVEDKSLNLTAPVALATVPVMVGSALAARYLDPSPRDLHMVSAVSLASAWTGFLLARSSGPDSTRDMHAFGGVLLGTGAGFIASIAASPFLDVEPSRSWGPLGFMLAGNAFGLGTHMVLQPLDERGFPGNNAWYWGTAIGGLAFGAGAAAAWPYLKFGPHAPDLTLAGAAYGSLTWYLATAAADTGVRRPEDPVFVGGGMLAGGAALATAGLVSSGWFNPTPWDHLVTATSTLAGVGVGLGTARLVAPDPGQRGLPDLAGVIGGSAVGFAAGAYVEHRAPLRGTDYVAGLAGAAYGTMAGALVPTLANEEWISSATEKTLRQERIVGASTMLGAGAAAALAATASNVTGARKGQVALPTIATALGSGMGLGLGMMLDDGSQGSRIGTLAGSTALLAASIATDPWLKLSEGLGPSAPQWGVVGTGLGLGYGLLFAQLPETPSSSTWNGGALFGSTAGLATGLVMSKYFDLTPGGAWTLAVYPALGGTFGHGLGLLTERTHNPIAERRLIALEAIGGAAAATAGAAFQNRYAPLERIDWLAGFLGAGYGTIFGVMAPTLGDRTWPEGPEAGQMIAGSALVGLSTGALAAAISRRATHARPGQVVLPTVAAVLGGSMGSGLGMMLDEQSQGTRIGVLAGSAALVATSIATDPWLKLSEGVGPSAPKWGLVESGLGFGYGLLLAQLPQNSSPSRGFGGALFGATAGLTTGLVTSKYADLTTGGAWTLAAYPLLGGLFGHGFALLTTSTPNPIAKRRADALEAIGGAAAANVGAVFQNRYAPLEGIDWGAGFLGAGYGTFFGLLAPTLGDRTWPQGPDAERTIFASNLMGLSAGALSSVIARRATGVGSRTLWNSAFGGLDGLATGLGVGLLISPADGSSSQPERIGLVAGAAAGLAIGATVWPSLKMTDERMALLRTSMVVLGWTGLWAPTIGEPNLGLAIQERAIGKRMWGGLLAGLGVGSLGTTLAAPALHIDEDLLNDGLLLYVIGNGAGAGAGALASERDDVPAAAMLGTGAVAFAAGALLHDRVDFRKSAPLIVGLAFEGAWLGGWSSVLLSTAPEGQPLLSGVTGRMFWGGTAAGLLTGVGAAALFGDQPEWPMRRTGISLLGSATLASISSGLMLMSPSLQNRVGAGIVTGASAAGFAVGAYVSPQLELSGRTFWLSVLGAGLGVAEANAFAWASEAKDSNQYLGASLVGAGIGTALGLTSSAATGTAAADTPAAAGFAAWGAWVGSFSGSLLFVNGGPEVHRVTFGGLVGLNAGFLVGLGLLRFHLIESRDIGWLSVFGGAGTLLGARPAAPTPRRRHPGPVLAGLAAGPVVGMVAGVIIWPRLRGTVQPQTSALEPEPGRPASSSGASALALFQVKDWQPVFTVLPSPTGRESTILIGAQGTLW